MHIYQPDHDCRIDFYMSLVWTACQEQSNTRILQWVGDVAYGLIRSDAMVLE